MTVASRRYFLCWIMYQAQGVSVGSPEVPQVDVGTALSWYSFQIVVGPS